MANVLISALPNITSSGYTRDDLLVMVGYLGAASGVTYHTPLTAMTQYISGTTGVLTGATFSAGTLTLKTPVGNITVTGFTDIYVTGGTYNSGTDTATFKNNSGGTFTVTGFTTGMYPAGVNEDVQYNNNGVFGAASLKYRNSNSSAWNRGTNSIASNTVFGEDAMRNTTGSGNTIYGYQSYYTSGSTGGYNTVMGYQSLYSNTSGSYNTAVGYQSQYSGTTGSGNTSIGYYSLRSNSTGSNNSAIGSGSLSANTTGNNNISIGSDTLFSNVTGSSNVSIGYQSLKQSNSNFNVGIGYQSLYSVSNVNSNTNVGIGYQAAYSFNDSNGGSIMAIGYQSVYSLTGSSSGSTFIGSNVLRTLTNSSYDNTFIGNSAGYSISTPISGNTVIGTGAAYYLTGNTNVVIGTDAGRYVSGNSNVIISSPTQASTQKGNNNISIGGLANGFNNVDGLIAIGPYSMYNTPSGSGNTAIGASSLSYLTTGTDNTAGGYAAMELIRTGSGNTTFGVSTMRYGFSGSSLNTAIGVNTFQSLSGNSNTGIGYNAGQYVVNASGMTIVGSFDNAGTNSGFTAGTNVTLIGYNALPPTSGYNTNNYIVLGNSSVTTIYGAVNLTSLSDRRDKKNIETLNLGIDFVEKLRPVTFEWDMRGGGKIDVKSSGFIAQEVSEVEKETNLSEYLNIVDTTDENRYLMTPGNLLPILVKAIQDLSKEQKELEEILKGLENK